MGNIGDYESATFRYAAWKVADEIELLSCKVCGALVASRPDKGEEECDETFTKIHDNWHRSLGIRAGIQEVSGQISDGPPF